MATRWSSREGGQRAKGLNIFPLAKDPGLLFVHEPFPDPPTPPSTSRLLFCPSRARTKRLRSRLLSHLPPILLSSRVPCSSYIPLYRLTIFTLVSTSRATFSFLDNRKNRGEKAGKKAHVRCCQSRRVFFRLSQTPNARLDFRLTDNRRGEDPHRWSTPLAPRFITFLAPCQTIHPSRLACIYPWFLSPRFILYNRLWLVVVMYDGGFETGIADWSWLEKIQRRNLWYHLWLTKFQQILFDKKILLFFFSSIQNSRWKIIIHIYFISQDTMLIDYRCTGYQSLSIHFEYQSHDAFGS